MYSPSTVVCSSTCIRCTGDFEEYLVVGVLGECVLTLMGCVGELSIIPPIVCKSLQTLFWGLMDPTHTYTRSDQWKNRDRAGLYEILGGLQQPRTRFLQSNLRLDSCWERTTEDIVGIGDNIEVFPSVRLGKHMQGKSAAGMKKEVCSWLHNMSTHTQLWLFNLRLGRSRRDLHSIPGTSLDEGFKF